MKKMIVLILFLLALFFGVDHLYKRWQKEKGEADELATWKEFVPTSGLFKAILPNEPQYGNDSVLIPKTNQKRHYDIYASEKVDGTLFLISVITYPPEVQVSVSDDVLRENLNALIQANPDNRLKKALDSVFRSHKTLEFSLENRDFDIEGKSIQDGQVVYMLTYVTRKDQVDEKEYQYFIDSFHIIK